MARLIPKVLPPGTPASEIKLHKSLATLDDQWTVLHSVKWQSKRNGKQGDGEADFVLLHPSHGILVIEVKGGGIDIKQGQWETMDRNGNIHPIKDPFQQATAAKHALIAYFKECNHSIDQISIVHAVAFPEINMTDAERLGPNAPKPITWHSGSLSDIKKSIQVTCTHWQAKCNITQNDIKKIVTLIAPTISIRRRLSDEVADIEEGLIELTEQQVRVFSQLRSARNALVMGGAGTGKTILAIERAKKLALENFSTLLICYNELLGKTLQNEVHGIQNITACTFHSLCLKEANKAKLEIPRTLSEDWWEDTAPLILMEAAAKTNIGYDAIVIDEGQDFSQPWIDALQLLTKSTIDAPIFIFADYHQQLYTRTWKVRYLSYKTGQD